MFPLPRAQNSSTARRYMTSETTFLPSKKAPLVKPHTELRSLLRTVNPPASVVLLTMPAWAEWDATQRRVLRVRVRQNLDNLATWSLAAEGPGSVQEQGTVRCLVSM